MPFSGFYICYSYFELPSPKSARTNLSCFYLILDKLSSHNIMADNFSSPIVLLLGYYRKHGYLLNLTLLVHKKKNYNSRDYYCGILGWQEIKRILCSYSEHYGKLTWATKSALFQSPCPPPTSHPPVFDLLCC